MKKVRISGWSACRGLVTVCGAILFCGLGALAPAAPASAAPAPGSTPSAAQPKGSFTLEQVLSAPYPTNLVSARDTGRIAWVFNAEGARNVWTAAPPDYAPVRLTSYAQDEVFEM